MPDAAYFRDWRAAHPDYRARQNRIRNARRRLVGRDRSREMRPSRAIPSVPGLHVGHELFDRARQIVGPRRTSLTELYDPLYDDLLSVATLAVIEGSDPEQAVKRYRSNEYLWGRITAPLFVW